MVGPEHTTQLLEEAAVKALSRPGQQPTCPPGFPEVFLPSPLHSWADKGLEGIQASWEVNQPLSLCSSHFQTQQRYSFW